MKIRFTLPLFVIGCFGCFSTEAQTNISGVVNQYAKVTYINPAKTKARVINNVFAAGDMALVIQMKGATIDNTNTANYGNITGVNSSGYYEFTTIQSVNADTVNFPVPLCRNFSPNDSVQIIKVPVYASANVTAALTCTAWGAGGVGGVLVLQVNGALTLNADIDVSNKGFRGGTISGTSFICSNINYYSGTSIEGQKGEGIAEYITNQVYGRGKLANGGGGASSGNSGGGGGGNYGAAGQGGNQYNGQCGTGYNGVGGTNLTYTTDRVFMGGGGGGPQHDNGYTVYPGGNGGGIVIIKAGSIVGNNHLIISNGQSITNVINDEGTSGGGAGGSIYLLCNTYNTALQINAKGGFGGSNNNIIFSTFCHGPGGGGGGGVVWFSTAATPAGITTNVTGGVAGTVNNPASSCYNTTYGAQPGSVGGVLYNLTDGITTTLGLNDSVVCLPNISIILNIGSGYTSVQWSTGATTPSITVTTPGVYTVQATNGLGCIAKDTSVITLDTMNLGNDTLICPNIALTLSPKPPGNYTSYLWQDASTGSSLSVTQPGLYYVTVHTLHNCIFSDSVKVQVDTIPKMRDTFLCNKIFSVQLSLPPNYPAYLWSTGQNTQTISVSQPDTYYAQMTTPHGCNFADTAVVGVDTMFLGNDTLVCENINYTLTPAPAGSFTSYFWQDGAMTPTYQVNKGGTYYVTVHSQHNCILSDTVNVQVDSMTVLNITASDAVICEGKNVIFHGSYTQYGNIGYEWDFGDGSAIQNTNPVNHSFDNTGLHTIKLKAYYRICPDDSTSKDVMVIPHPVINIGPDTTICPNGEPVLISDLINAVNSGATWLWNNGQKTSNILVKYPGIYAATVTVDGCSTTDSITILKDCYIDIPNGFTPNGDGDNDYFLPRQLLSKSVTSFTMQIFNRWGQMIYETTNLNGRGWDGKFNDKDQMQGVYIYQIDVSFANKTKEQYTGNVTLLR